MKITTILALLLASVFCGAQTDGTLRVRLGSGVVLPAFKVAAADTTEAVTVLSGGLTFLPFSSGKFGRTDWHYRNGRFTRCEDYDWAKQGGAPLLVLSRIWTDTFESWHLYNIGVSDARFERIADLMCDSIYTGRVVGWSCDPGDTCHTRKLDIYQNKNCWAYVPKIDNDAEMLARLRRAILNSRNPNYPRPKGLPWPCPPETPTARPVEVRRDTVRLFSGSGNKQ